MIPNNKVCCGKNVQTCENNYFPACQVRVVRFYVSCLALLLLSSPPPLVVLLLSLSSSSRCPPRPPAQLRLAIHSVLCRTSTTTIHAQCSLPDLNHDHPRPVFPAGPQPRVSTPSVPCRTSTGRGWSWLRSGREHWAWILAVEVRQGTLGGDGRGWGPAGNM